MSNLYFKRWDSSFSKKFDQTPKWILFSGLAGMAISLVAVIVILDYLKDATDIVNNYGLNNTELIIAILSKKLIGMFCLGVFVLSAAAVLGYFIVPLCHALLDTLFDALFFKDSFKNTSKTEGTIQEESQSKPQNAKEPDNKQNELTAKQRIDRIRQLIVDCFWSGSIWGRVEGEDYTTKFEKSLEKTLNEKKNVMKLGHLAYILWDKDWTAETWPSFKDWIITFFEVLCMRPPRDTSPNKYSYSSENNLSPYSTTFSKIDKEFEYLLDEKYQATLKTQNRPRHESTS